MNNILNMYTHDLNFNNHIMKCLGIINKDSKTKIELFD